MYYDIIISRSVGVLDTAYLKSYSQNLKDKLSVDPKYLPFHKVIHAELTKIDPFFAEIKRFLEADNQKHLKNIIEINKKYATHLDNFEKSLKLLVEKNNHQIEKSHKDKTKKSHDAHQTYKLEITALDQELLVLQQKANEELAKIDQSTAREISKIQKVMQEIRKVYQLETTDIESYHEKRKLELKDLYHNNTEILEHHDDELKIITEEKLKILRAKATSENAINDDIYLAIKTNYNAMTVAFNKKINDIKKRYAQELPKLEKIFENRKVPMAEALDALKKTYDQAKIDFDLEYSNKINQLNLDFELKKETYETRKTQIIHESNEAITLLNSKLSAFREGIQKQKTETSKALREEMRNLETEFEKDKLNHKLTKELQTFDNDLNKQILRTNEDISLRQKDQHAKLFLHDQKHLQEIHDWKFQKALAEYEKKQNYHKLEINYNYQIQIQEETLKHYIAHHHYHKELLRLTQNLELLPLEHQLLLAASIQERELNILANDAHETMADYKHQEWLFEHQKSLDDMLFVHQKAIEDLNYQNGLLSLSAQVQLKLEKERIIRDYQVEEQELRIELLHMVSSKQQKDIEQKLTQDTHDIESRKEILTTLHQKELQTYKNENLFEQKKREAFIQEAKFKNQLRIQHEKSERMLSIHKNELESHQIEIESIFETIRHFDKLAEFLENQAIKLYHLPTHPEVFKETLKLLQKLHQELHETLKEFIKNQQDEDQSYFLKKIEDSTGYKYMVKHQNLMDSYAVEIQKIKESKDLIDIEIQKLENQFFITQSDFDRTTTQIEQLTKAIELIKDTTFKADKNHYSIKDKQNIMHTHEIELKYIKKKLQSIENEIDLKHKSHQPLDKKMDKILAKQKAAESILDGEKTEENAFFRRSMQQNQKHYQNLLSIIEDRFNNIFQFYQKLIGELYVSDNFISLAKKALDRNHELFLKQTLKMQGQYLDHILGFYQSNKNNQDTIDSTFMKSTWHLINNQQKVYDSFVNSFKHDEELQVKKLEQTLSQQKQKASLISSSDFQNFEKKKALDLQSIRTLEQKISDAITKRSNEEILLDQNLIQVKSQYENDRLNQVKNLESTKDKWIIQHQLKLTQTEKTHLQMNESLAQKSQAILEKFIQNSIKMVENLNHKKQEINQMIEREHANDQERDRALDQKFKVMKMQQTSDLKMISDSIDDFQMSQRRIQDREFNKDFKMLKKSHHFKIKMLHLN